MAKYSVEEILKEYGPDGKRSGIRESRSQPLSHGTLESEKILLAATSSEPLKKEKVGYRSTTSHLEEKTSSEPSDEELVDIKSTISNIRAQKVARKAQEGTISPVVRERFPTQYLQRNNVSYLKSNRMSGPSYSANSYNNPSNQTSSTSEESYHPQIRMMNDSTRAREKNRRRPKSRDDLPYAQESPEGVVASSPNKRQTRPSNSSHPSRQDKEDPYGYTQAASPKERAHSTVSSTKKRFESATTNDNVDNMEQIREQLHSLTKGVVTREIILLILFVFGIILAIIPTFITDTFGLRGYAVINVAVGLFSCIAAFPTIHRGIVHLIRFRADSDSCASVPAVLSLILAILTAVFPEILDMPMVHIYVPCGILALLLSMTGRLLSVRRATRNCNVLTNKSGDYNVISHIETEQSAQALTRGLVHDYPIVATTRKADHFHDFLRNTYSYDTSDNLCRRIVPIVTIIALLIAVALTGIRLGWSIDSTWICTGLSLWTLLETACCMMACAITANLPLNSESKKATSSESCIIGFQSVDAFYDMNALIIPASELFPPETVQLVEMKIMSSERMDNVLVDVASLLKKTESILNACIQNITPKNRTLHDVQEIRWEEGSGISGWISNRRVLFGNRELMESHNVEGLPTRRREAEWAGEDNDVVYFSTSGVLSAMFSIKINVNATIARRMRGLANEGIALGVRSVDYMLTSRRIAELFDFPVKLLRVLDVSVTSVYERETAKEDNASASLIAGKSGFASAGLLIAVKRIRRSATIGNAIQITGMLLGFLLAMAYMITGSYEDLTARFFLIYHLIITLITVISLKIMS